MFCRSNFTGIMFLNSIGNVLRHADVNTVINQTENGVDIKFIFDHQKCSVINSIAGSNCLVVPPELQINICMPEITDIPDISLP